MTKAAKRKIKNTAALERLIEELSGVLDELGSFRPGSSDDVEASSDIESAMDVNSENVEEEHQGTLFVDPEDIQYLVDGAISVLIDEKLIKVKKNEAPSLSGVLKLLLGSETNLAGEADYFEEMINGYEGSIHIDDLTVAYDTLSSVIDELKSIVAAETNKR